MPDLTTLMTEWPEEFEKVLRISILPTATLNSGLKEYVDIVCGKLGTFKKPSNHPIGSKSFRPCRPVIGSRELCRTPYK